MTATNQTIHHRAYVQGRAVAYCTAGNAGPQPTSTQDAAKVTCPRCKAMRQGRST